MIFRTAGSNSSGRSKTPDYVEPFERMDRLERLEQFERLEPAQSAML